MSTAKGAVVTAGERLQLKEFAVIVSSPGGTCHAHPETQLRANLGS